MVQRPSDELTDFLKPERLTSVVDVGANPIDGDPPYKGLLQRRLCRLIGFDPFPDVLNPLNASKSDLETYLPYAVGDGGSHTLKLCRGIGFASLLQPDPAALMHFPRFSELGQVVREIPLETRRLDDIAEIDALDFLKIDIQGSELSVISHGRARLAKAVAVQIEVSFIPLYVDQPVFGDIDLALRGLGFVPHMFAAINKKMIAPMLGPTPAAAMNQMVEADAVYVRDFIKADRMDSEQLKHLAVIAHHCYGSFDLVVNCVHHLERRKAVAAGTLARYLDLVRNSKPASPNAQPRP